VQDYDGRLDRSIIMSTPNSIAEYELSNETNSGNHKATDEEVRKQSIGGRNF
jgi:hypothetical protein